MIFCHLAIPEVIHKALQWAAVAEVCAYRLLCPADVTKPHMHIDDCEVGI